jgi:hypothetical protein
VRTCGAKLAVFLAALLAAGRAGAGPQVKFTLPSGVVVAITEAPFARPKFRVSGCTDEGAACFINGHVPFGRASRLPRTYVERIAVSFGGSTYILDSSDMYDAWGERPLEHAGKVRYFGGRCTDSKNCQVRGLFSDGAASFVAEWRVVNGRATRTVLTDSTDVVDLFMRHIDPPVFE